MQSGWWESKSALPARGAVVGPYERGKLPLMSFPSAALRVNSAQDEQELMPGTDDRKALRCGLVALTVLIVNVKLE